MFLYVILTTQLDYSSKNLAYRAVTIMGCWVLWWFLRWACGVFIFIFFIIFNLILIRSYRLIVAMGVCDILIRIYSGYGCL